MIASFFAVLGVVFGTFTYDFIGQKNYSFAVGCGALAAYFLFWGVVGLCADIFGDDSSDEYDDETQAS